MHDAQPPGPDEPGLVPGARLGPFRLVEPLGRGATGAVWSADAQEAVDGVEPGARVALKILHRRLVGDADARSRLEREARVGLGLRHPSLVRTLATGVSADPSDGEARPWIAMELVAGRTLRDLMRELGRVPEPLLRDVARQAALALEAVHAQGVVHRDLKPGNLIVTPDQQVRVMDLGVAIDPRDEARLTQAGMFVGTLLYASPEQFGRGSIGPASDLYSLGVLLYEASTAAQPFDAPEVRGVIRRHLDHVPERAGTLDPSISPFFEELLAHLLEKDPAQRPASAAALAAILLEGEGSAWWREREQALRAASPHGEIRRARPAPAARLVGRATELEVLEDAVNAAAGGAGGVVVVEGEAGIGKSRLLEELAAHVLSRSDDMLLLRSASAPGEAGLGHAALGRALLDHLGASGLRRVAGELLGETPRLASALVSHATAEPPPPGEAPLPLEGLATALVTLVRGLAERHPVAWLVEDLHVASAETRALVLALSRLAARHRLALVVTSRPRTPEADELARLPGARRVTLARLSPAQSVRLIASALGSETTADRIGGRIARKADGNPFFILEMLREMKERGLLREDSDGWRASGDTAALDVPSSVRDFLSGRLRDLSDDDRAILDVAAVIGFAFDPDLVARVLGRPRLAVLQSLASLSRRSGVVRGTGAGFEFDHHQLQEVVVQGLPPLLRAEYHALVAEAWRDRAGLAGADPAAVPVEAACFLAEHLLRGGRGREGVAFAPRAVDALAARSELEAAIGLGELAWSALAEGDDVARCDLALTLAGCLTLLGRREREREMAEAALAAARRLGDAPRESQALRAVGIHLLATARYADALPVLEAAVARGEEAGDRNSLARALGPLAAVLFRMGDYERARAAGERCVAAAAAARDAISEASGLGQLATILERLGDTDGALALITRSGELARSLGRRRLESMALSRAALCLLAQCRFDEARTSLERSAAIAAELGHAGLHADESLALSFVALAQGRLDEARRHAATAAALHADARSLPGEAAGLDSLAAVALVEGRLGEAREMLGRCEAIGREIRSPVTLGFAALLRGQIADAEGGDGASVVAALEEAARIAEEMGDRGLMSHARLELARHHVERGDPAAARHALEAAGSLEPAWLVELLRATASDARTAPPMPERASFAHRVIGLACRARITRDASELAAARALLEAAIARLGTAERERFRECSPLARFVRAAERDVAGAGS